MLFLSSYGRLLLIEFSTLWSDSALVKLLLLSSSKSVISESVVCGGVGLHCCNEKGTGRSSNSPELS
jgi:hypothetical protein